VVHSINVVFKHLIDESINFSPPTVRLFAQLAWSRQKEREKKGGWDIFIISIALFLAPSPFLCHSPFLCLIESCNHQNNRRGSVFIWGRCTVFHHAVWHSNLFAACRLWFHNSLERERKRKREKEKEGHSHSCFSERHESACQLWK